MSAKSPSELIARHEAFLVRGPADRPLLGLWLGGYYPAEQFPHGAAAWRNGQPLTPQDVRLTAAFRSDYEHLYTLHREADDDFFYVGSAYWGIPWMEAILGCPVFAGPETAWTRPVLENPAAISQLSTDLDRNPWWECLLNFSRDLMDLAANRFPVCPPLLRGPGDLASALLGGTEFALGCMDAPEAMRALLAHCAVIRLEVVRRLQAEIPAWHGAYAAGGYPSKIWSRRRVAYNQEDAAALLSPALFREFLLPLDRRQAAAAEIAFIHLHSACLYPVEILLEDGAYAVLEINLDHAGAGPEIKTLLPVFQRIQQTDRPLLLWGQIGKDDRRRLLHELNPRGLSLQPIISCPEDLNIWQH
jgi:hypothetical protein